MPRGFVWGTEVLFASCKSALLEQAQKRFEVLFAYLSGLSARLIRLRSCTDSIRLLGVIPSSMALLQSAKTTGRHRVGRGGGVSPSNLPLSRRVGIPAALASRTGHTPDEASITPRVTQLSDQRESVFAKLPKTWGKRPKWLKWKKSPNFFRESRAVFAPLSLISMAPIARRVIR